MNDRINLHGLQVDKGLHALINDEAIPATGIDADKFWEGVAKIIKDLSPKNQALLDHRNMLEKSINEWHIERKGSPHDSNAYRQFLMEIGYLAPEAADFKATTENVDDEITSIPGPQLVVPVNNARYAINAANARWGSLYDALYGTDVIAEKTAASMDGYDPSRGATVVAYANNFLDQFLPLDSISHSNVTAYSIENGLLIAHTDNNQDHQLSTPSQLR